MLSTVAGSVGGLETSRAQMLRLIAATLLKLARHAERQGGRSDQQGRLRLVLTGLGPLISQPKTGTQMALASAVRANTLRTSCDLAMELLWYRRIWLRAAAPHHQIPACRRLPSPHMSAEAALSPSGSLPAAVSSHLEFLASLSRARFRRTSRRTREPVEPVRRERRSGSSPSCPRQLLQNMLRMSHDPDSTLLDVRHIMSGPLSSHNRGTGMPDSDLPTVKLPETLEVHHRIKYAVYRKQSSILTRLAAFPLRAHGNAAFHLAFSGDALRKILKDNIPDVHAWRCLGTPDFTLIRELADVYPLRHIPTYQSEIIQVLKRIERAVKSVTNTFPDRQALEEKVLPYTVEVSVMQFKTCLENLERQNTYFCKPPPPPKHAHAAQGQCRLSERDLCAVATVA